MAGFKTHVTVSSLLGCGYAGAGVLYGVPLDTALLGGAMCGFSGMLPDLDSDYGTPLRETMCFTAAVLPMLLLHRFASVGLSPDEMALAAVTLYLFMRFGVTNMIRKYTVHRGMFHSIPAGLVFAGIAFLVCGSTDINLRYFKAGGVFAGFMSHLILDEIYSFEWKSGAWHIKRSFGTALKLWGKDTWANVSTYAKLVVVGGMIMSEPSVLAQLQARDPGLAQRIESLEGRYRSWSDKLQSAATEAIRPEAETKGWNPFASLPPHSQAAPAAQSPPYYEQPTIEPQYSPTVPNGNSPFDWPPVQNNEGFDTARRPAWPAAQ